MVKYKVLLDFQEYLIFCGCSFSLMMHFIYEGKLLLQLPLQEVVIKHGDILTQNPAKNIKTPF